MPMLIAATDICDTSFSEMTPCCRSKNNPSKPHVFAASAMSTVRAWRIMRFKPRPPLFMRSASGFLSMADSDVATRFSLSL